MAQKKSRQCSPCSTTVLLRLVGLGGGTGGIRGPVDSEVAGSVLDRDTEGTGDTERMERSEGATGTSRLLVPTVEEG